MARLSEYTGDYTSAGTVTDRQMHTAVGGETTFELTFIDGSEEVYVDGVRLLPGASRGYTTSPGKVTLNSPMTFGQTILLTGRANTSTIPYNKAAGESVVLTDGQTEVIFRSIETEAIELYVSGPLVDRGRLVAPVDFEVKAGSVDTIVLKSTFPAGTMIEGVQGGRLAWLDPDNMVVNDGDTSKSISARFRDTQESDKFFVQTNSAQLQDLVVGLILYKWVVDKDTGEARVDNSGVYPTLRLGKSYWQPRGTTDDVQYVVANWTATDDLLDLTVSDPGRHAISHIYYDRRILGGKDIIAPEWTTACQTKEQFEAKRDTNKRMYPASGFHDMGQHDVVAGYHVPVNQGLFTHLSKPNHLMLGRGFPAKGTSVSPWPRALVAGVVSDILGVFSTDVTNVNYITLPDAPDGRDTFDSATGAVTRHASAAEAFEGLATNGDFRSGGSGWSGGVGTRTFSDGKVRMTTNSSTLCYLTRNANFVSGKSYTISFTIENVSHNDVSVYNYSSKDISGVIGTGIVDTTVYVSHTFTAGIGSGTSVGIDVRISGVAGHWADIRNVSVMPVTEEVVTRRVDMFGGEYLLREVTVADSWVYAKGAVQSQVTSMSGVTTKANTQRPQSYFDQYSGQGGSKGKGVDFWSASDAQRLLLVSDTSNNLYYNDGKVYQWCYRVRTFAGAGNGDWYNVSSNSSSRTSLKFSDKARVRPQGNTDDSTVYNTDDYGYRCTDLTDNKQPERGLFTLHHTELYKTAGECYFQVWGMVPRLNQGAYHPQFNEFGTSYWSNQADGLGTTVAWHNQYLQYATSTLNCFEYANKTTTGAIGGSSGRPDGRLYDAIYASGLGGVNDYRMTCKDTGTPEYVAGKMQDIIGGSYRGAEKLKFTHIQNSILGTGQDVGKANHWRLVSPTSGFLYLDIHDHFKGAVGDAVHIWDTDADVYFKAYVSTVGGNYLSFKRVTGMNGYTPATSVGLSSDTSNIYVVTTAGSDTTVSGEYTHTDVVGSLTRIRTMFPDGFYGGWVPEVPDGSTRVWSLTYPALSMLPTLEHLGSNWASAASWWDNMVGIRNGKAAPLAANYVGIFTYKTKARQTEPTTRQEILHGNVGVGEVFASKAYSSLLGRYLGFSLTDRINVDRQSNVYSETVPLSSYSIDERDGKFYTDETYRPLPTHGQLSLGSTEDASPAYKVLSTQFSENKQSNLQLNYSELAYDANSFAPWGDDGKISIVNDTIATDTNGTSVKRGTHKLVKPFGYTW